MKLVCEKHCGCGCGRVIPQKGNRKFFANHGNTWRLRRLWKKHPAETMRILDSLGQDRPVDLRKVPLQSHGFILPWTHFRAF